MSRLYSFFLLIAISLLCACGNKQEQDNGDLSALPDALKSPVEGVGTFWLKDTAKNLIDGFVMREGFEINFDAPIETTSITDECVDSEGKLNPEIASYIDRQLEENSTAFYSTFADQSIYHSYTWLQKNTETSGETITYFLFGKLSSDLTYECRMAGRISEDGFQGLEQVRSRMAVFLTQVFKLAEQKLFENHMHYVGNIGIKFVGDTGQVKIDEEAFWRDHFFTYHEISPSTLQDFVEIIVDYTQSTKVYKEAMDDWQTYILSYSDRDDRQAREVSALTNSTKIDRYLEISRLLERIQKVIQFSIDNRFEDEIFERQVSLGFAVERKNEIFETTWNLELMRRRYFKRAPIGSSIEEMIPFLQDADRQELVQGLERLKNQLKTGRPDSGGTPRNNSFTGITIFFYHQILPQKLALVDQLYNEIK